MPSSDDICFTLTANVVRETRSYGKFSQNQLSELKIIPFPIERLSQIEVQKNEVYPAVSNQIIINSSHAYATFLYFINAQCPNIQCYVGIDQAYDDLWLAFDTNLRILPHYRYNNWANLWQFDGQQKIMIVYLPQIVSYFCLLGLIVVIALLFIRLFPLIK